MNNSQGCNALLNDVCLHTSKSTFIFLVQVFHFIQILRYVKEVIGKRNQHPVHTGSPAPTCHR